MRSLALRSTLGLLLLLGLAAPSPGADILLLSIECGGTPEYFQQALTDAGLDFDLVTDAVSAQGAILSGHYRWVIVDTYNYGFGFEDTSTAVLADFVADGGCSYISTWTWSADPALAAIYEASFVSDYTTPIPIYRWNAAHPLFTAPNALGDLTPTPDTCGIDGARFDVVGGGTAIGGYVPAPAASEAGIIIGNEGRTVLFGGITGLFSGDGDGDTIPDGQEIAENVVAYLSTQQCDLGGGTTVAIPTVSGIGLTALALVLAAAAIVALRRRTTA